MTEFHYIGSELRLFARAHRWKAYWSSQIRPYLSGDVLEVGAGIGANTPLLVNDQVRRWVCLEPDHTLIAEMKQNLEAAGIHTKCEYVHGELRSVHDAQKFDSIIYVDVLEHIQDDRGELCDAAARLRPGGRLVVLAPAHPHLYTAFDAAIGHHRRYNKQALRRITPPGVILRKLMYLDCVGVSASTANRLLLHQSMPTEQQISVWDRWMIPTSVVLDRLIGYSVGKTILAVWCKPS